MTDLDEMQAWAKNRLETCRTKDNFIINVGRYEALVALLDELAERRRVPDPFADVGAFNRKFSIPAFDPSRGPKMLGAALEEYRIRFQQEETDELQLGFLEGDMEKVVDAVCDIVYVGLGTLHFMNANFYRHWSEVQRANMAKEKADETWRQGRAAGLGDGVQALEVMKPPGWRPPDHGTILREQGKGEGSSAARALASEGVDPSGIGKGDYI